MSAPLNFPVSTRELQAWLPHRSSAVWVDEVSWVKPDEGECRVHLNAAANYADHHGRIRYSSFVEWMAQAYGFVCACQMLEGIVKVKDQPKKAFLVHVSDFDMTADPSACRIPEAENSNDQWITVYVKKKHQVGPIALVEGVVRSSQNRILAQAKFKVFAE